MDTPDRIAPSSKPEPRVIAERDGLRLVHQVRDPRSWPNMADLTLERHDKDAMGQEHWVTITGWCLSTRTLPLKGEEDRVIVVLKMLTDAGAVIGKETR